MTDDDRRERIRFWSSVRFRQRLRLRRWRAQRVLSKGWH